LSAGRYKSTISAEIEYDPPAMIIRDLQGIENKIQTGLEQLLKVLEETQ
jgi:hypothetical protein